MILEPYAYTGEKLLFTMNPFEVVPNLCDVKYSCKLISMPDEAMQADLCEYASPDSLT